ncbi:DNA-binding protein [Emericellopsis cladophorae]|uniref:DNA-binding protein n=1 Tax=Emericellopsis cladophorae TaxID=2686198 RepID=A0A9P9XZ07_9HYPO|nr:DNA-binding protein [Emericellopsis cladophorae]KAI6780241.1 DNA-binding protein [Emericellopsis cladophorae]
MKDSETVVKEFNEIVNMTASELEKWLKSDDSRSAGWPKDDGEHDGESVGHDSGRKIVEILKSNPDKKEDRYTDEQIQHMRKVVSYCKRHLAQEEKSNDQKSAEEVKKTKSYASLKNWGHDPLKKRGEAGSSGSKEDVKEEADEEEEEEAADDEDIEEEDADEDSAQEERQAGDKRKKSAGAQSGANKKRETRQSKAPNGNKNDEKENDEKENDEKENDENEDAEDGVYSEEEGEDKSTGKKPKKGPQPGDTVSWNWGNGNPEGKVLDVKAEKTSVTTKRGNEVTRDGNPEDPAVVLDTGKSKAIKSNHELN